MQYDAMWDWNALQWRPFSCGSLPRCMNFKETVSMEIENNIFRRLKPSNLHIIQQELTWQICIFTWSLLDTDPRRSIEHWAATSFKECNSALHAAAPTPHWLMTPSITDLHWLTTNYNRHLPTYILPCISSHAEALYANNMRHTHSICT